MSPKPAPRPRVAARLLRSSLLVALLLAAAQVSAQSLRIDIDRADAATLAESLPGIGPVKARRIVEHRERHGPFGSVEALDAVKGIGPATLEAIRAYLSGASVGRASPPGGRADESRVATPFSSTEEERAVRLAVRDIVGLARRDAAAVLSDDGD